MDVSTALSKSSCFCDNARADLWQKQFDEGTWHESENSQIWRLIGKCELLMLAQIHVPKHFSEENKTLFKTCVLWRMFAFKRQSTMGGSLSWWFELQWRSGRREVWNTVWVQDNRLCDFTEVHNITPHIFLLIFPPYYCYSYSRKQKQSTGHDSSEQDEVLNSARGRLKVSWWLQHCAFRIVSSADLLWLWEGYRKGVVRRAQCCYFSWRNKTPNKMIWKEESCKFT